MGVSRRCQGILYTVSTGFWTVDRDTLGMGEPNAVHRQWLPYHPVSLCGVGDALPAQVHGCVCLLSPDTVQSRGLIKASCDRPHPQSDLRAQ